MTPGITCFYDVGFGARAVSCKTPIYFMYLSVWNIIFLRSLNPWLFKNKVLQGISGMVTTYNKQPGQPRASLLVEHWEKQTFAKSGRMDGNLKSLWQQGKNEDKKTTDRPQTIPKDWDWVISRPSQQVARSLFEVFVQVCSHPTYQSPQC